MVTSVGVMVKLIPPHAAPVIALTVAFALIVTVNWNDDPLPHAAVFGVTV